jgi:hypothetical protein
MSGVLFGVSAIQPNKYHLKVSVATLRKSNEKGGNTSQPLMLVRRQTCGEYK